MTGGDRLASRLSAGKQPTFLQRYSCVASRGTRLPPLSQQIEHLVRKHHIAVLAALRLLDANDVLCAVDMLDLEPHDLARPQPALLWASAVRRGAHIVGTPFANISHHLRLYVDWT